MPLYTKPICLVIGSTLSTLRSSYRMDFCFFSVANTTPFAALILVQIEYALAAVAGGAPIKAANGVVLATEKKQKSILYDERSVDKVEPITKHIGLVYSGMGPDYGVLVHRARKLAQQYYLVYQEPIPTAQLVQRVASVMQEYTQSGGVCPFGVSLLVCGWNEGQPYLFQSDPSGAYLAWKATAVGKNYDNIEVGNFNEAGFRGLTPTEVKITWLPAGIGTNEVSALNNLQLLSNF
uniref:Proteasome 20S subunit alpha 2 n=1 Tax=Gorilla gorilla gorilla TaxID=9595 RepID=G3RS11_GORGO